MHIAVQPGQTLMVGRPAHYPQASFHGFQVEQNPLPENHHLVAQSLDHVHTSMGL